jgi:hypothetical protein
VYRILFWLKLSGRLSLAQANLVQAAQAQNLSDAAASTDGPRFDFCAQWNGVFIDIDAHFNDTYYMSLSIAFS